MVSVKWYGTNALEFKYSNGTFMIDPYVSRNPGQLTVPQEQKKYLTSSPDFVLMTHAHWDHLPDMPFLIQKTNTVLYASRTACNIMRSLGVAERNLHELSYGEVLDFPQGVKVTAIESRHMGVMPEENFYDTMQPAETFTRAEAWRCGEIFAFLIECDDIKILNIGSANIHIPTMHDLSCDYLIGGISRWKDGFPELLSEIIKYKYLIPTHHDEFTLPLDQFYLRNDLDRLKEAIPALKYKELKILDWVNLTAVQGKFSR